jgi:hypothetical protein
MIAFAIPFIGSPSAASLPQKQVSVREQDQLSYNGVAASPFELLALGDLADMGGEVRCELASNTPLVRLLLESISKIEDEGFAVKSYALECDEENDSILFRIRTAVDAEKGHEIYKSVLKYWLSSTKVDDVDLPILMLDFLDV